ncbi:hypothetical protein SteCoe_32020 [Stentor coeruleus]|uniref:Uncharacterized protein n=1 Tax=Stentor coeruleus TaxID=5963 RepID=A0A1R2B0C4_9CILI|nr:hypothetical protein SteCoe_32020 [Stentor coeruleus]
MESKNIPLNLIEKSDEEFFDAVESFESSSEKAFKTFNTPTLKDFSPILKLFSSESGFTVNDFQSDNPLNTSTISKQIINNRNTRTWNRKEKLKKKNKEFYEFSNLQLVQELEISQKGNCIINFSPDGRFISVAGDNPMIILYEICRQKFPDEQFLLYDEPFEIYTGHTYTVTDLCWSANSLYFLSSALDGMVYKWSIAQKTPQTLYKHNLEVICISIHPQSQDLFFTGCKDNRVRIWNMNISRIDCDIVLESEITTGTFSPNGLLIIGLTIGICNILTYNCFSKTLQVVYRVDCRNKHGPKSSGRKITGIDFVDDNLFLVSSNDSRIRLFTTENFEIKQKYKGLKNENSKIVATYGKNSGHVISGSENGNVYIWNLFSKYVPKFNPIFTKKKRYKNSSYEFFSIENHKMHSYARLAPEKIVIEVQKRYAAAKQNWLVNNIIIVSIRGSLLVFYNKEAIKSRSNNQSKSFA